jgi:hypothetical protein
MAHYTAYLLDDQGNILSRAEINASDDATAIDAGWQLVATHATDPDPAPGSRGLAKW